MFQKYFAIIERGTAGEFGVFFPDIDGCTSGGKTITEAITNAGEALQGHIESLYELGRDIPEASADPGVFVDDADVDVATIAAVHVRIPEELGRYNVKLDKGLVAAIDAIAPNRSAFLQEAAGFYLRHGSKTYRVADRRTARAKTDGSDPATAKSGAIKKSAKKVRSKRA